MENLASNVLKMVRLQYEINAVSQYLINCPIDAVDFDEKLASLKAKKDYLERFKNSFKPS